MTMENLGKHEEPLHSPWILPTISPQNMDIERSYPNLVPTISVQYLGIQYDIYQTMAVPNWRWESTCLIWGDVQSGKSYPKIPPKMGHLPSPPLLHRRWPCQRRPHAREATGRTQAADLLVNGITIQSGAPKIEFN